MGLSFDELMPPTDNESDLKKILKRTRLDIGGGSQQGNVSAIGGRLGYNQPIDDTSSVNVGVSGHAAKGKGWRDAGLDRADLEYQKKLESGHKLKASLGAGKGGIDSAKVSYEIPFKKGGKVKPKSTASSRADGIAKKGKTRGRYL